MCVPSRTHAPLSCSIPSPPPCSRLPPPPLPARPVSMERSSSLALAKLQSSPDFIRGVGAGGIGAAGNGGAMPPPLPDRPSNAAFEKADLHAIRESNASSLR